MAESPDMCVRMDRVQIEAAAALGATAHAANGYAGLHHLIAFYRERCCEPGEVSLAVSTAGLASAPSFVQKAYGPAELSTYLGLQVPPPGCMQSVHACCVAAASAWSLSAGVYTPYCAVSALQLLSPS